jgi:hypothetical protein
MKYMSIYSRPHIDKYLGRRSLAGRLFYPYPYRMLKDNDVFDLLVLDGGAFFFTNEFLDGKSTDTFIRAFKTGRLLEPWHDFERT